MQADFPERDRIAAAVESIPPGPDPTMIDAMIAERRAALDSAGADAADRARLAYAVAFALNQRFQRTEDVADLRTAVPYLRIAVEAGANDLFHARYLSELGAALGSLAEAGADAGLAAEATELTERALAATADGHPQHATRLAQHGVALCRRGQLTGSVADLDAGVERLRAAVSAAHPADLHRGAHLGWLAVGLMLRHQRTGSAADVDVAAEAAGYAGLNINPYDLAALEIPSLWTAITRVRRELRGAAGRSRSGS